jgi:phospholipid/cholesterol/gamma-HCH transport system substrate-binding protein
MESRTNYAIVGIFVLLFSAGVIFFAFWLGKYGFNDEYDLYKVYTTESVSGLSMDASVKYRGVDVGSVGDISINPKNTKEIVILLKVKKGTPVTKGMKAELKYFGLTGLAYIELTGGKAGAPLLSHKNGHIPILKTKPSLYSRLDTTLTDITAKIAITLDKIDKLLNDKNIQNISKTIENTKEVTGALKDSKENIKKAIVNFLKIEQNINALSDSLKETSKKISSSSDAFKDMSISIKNSAKEKLDQLLLSINSVSKQANNLIKNVLNSINNGDYNIKQISASTITQINQAVRELKILLKEGEEMVEELKNSPSDIIYKKQTPTLGPGEKMP